MGNASFCSNIFELDADKHTALLLSAWDNRASPTTSGVLTYPLTEAEMSALVERLPQCAKLEAIRLYSCIEDKVWFRNLVDSVLAVIPNLNALELDGNKHTNEDAKSIAKLVDCKPLIKRLSLRFNSIGDAGIVCLANSLSRSPNLEVLHLGNNAFGLNGCRALSSSLLGCNLKELLLDQNDIGAEGMKFLAEGLCGCPHMQELSLSNCRIGNKGCEILSETISFLKMLKSLRLGGNGVTDARALNSLLTSLSKTKLKFLCLSNNEIGDEGCKAIAQALLVNTKTLKILFLSRCGMADAGNLSLAFAIRHNCSLAYLDISWNECSVDTAKEYEKSVKDYNHTVTGIELYTRKSQDEDSEQLAIVASLKSVCDENQKLTRLSEKIGNMRYQFPATLWPKVLEPIARKPDLLFNTIKRSLPLFYIDGSTITRKRANKRRHERTET